MEWRRGFKDAVPASFHTTSNTACVRVQIVLTAPLAPVEMSLSLISTPTYALNLLWADLEGRGELGERAWRWGEVQWPGKGGAVGESAPSSLNCGFRPDCPSPQTPHGSRLAAETEHHRCTRMKHPQVRSSGTSPCAGRGHCRKAGEREAPGIESTQDSDTVAIFYPLGGFYLASRSHTALSSTMKGCSRFHQEPVIY